MIGLAAVIAAGAFGLAAIILAHGKADGARRIGSGVKSAGMSLLIRAETDREAFYAELDREDEDDGFTPPTVH